MKVGVTGANGYVGAALCRQLAGSEFDVVRLVRHGNEPDMVAIGDIGPDTDWAQALDGCDLLVHLAARVHVMDEHAPNPQAEFERVNLHGTAQVARAALRAGVKRFVLMSTVKVHGERTCAGQAFKETDQPMPQDAYAASKLAGELALQDLAAGSAMEWVIIRPPLIYGPGVKANLAALARAAAKGLPLPLGSIQNLRSMVSLDNLADFVTCCLTHPMAANQHFLISDGHDLSTPDLVRQLAMAAGQVPRLPRIPVALLKFLAAILGKSSVMARLSDNLQVDISKAQALLGWHPVMTVNQGLQTLGEAAQKQ